MRVGGEHRVPECRDQGGEGGRPLVNPFSARDISVIAFLFLFHLVTEDEASGIFNTISEWP